MKPLVTVVIPAFNEEKYIKQAIESILAQTYSNWEMLIVDDASTDSTLRIARGFQDSRIRIVTNSINKGAGAAQNRGFTSARGSLIAILAADDIAYPERLQTQAKYMSEHPNIGVLSTGYAVINELGEKVKDVQFHIDPLQAKWKLLFGNPVAAPTVMFRAKIIVECGMYDESLRYGEDMEYWGRICPRWNIAIIPRILTKYRTHRQSITNNMLLENKQLSVSNIVRKNITAITGLKVKRSVSLLLATPLGVQKKFNKSDISLCIGTIIACQEIIEQENCVNIKQKKEIARCAQESINRMVRHYGIHFRDIRKILKSAKIYRTMHPSTLLCTIKAYIGYCKAKIVRACRRHVSRGYSE